MERDSEGLRGGQSCRSPGRDPVSRPVAGGQCHGWGQVQLGTPGGHPGGCRGCRWRTDVRVGLTRGGSSADLGLQGPETAQGVPAAVALGLDPGLWEC